MKPFYERREWLELRYRVLRRYGRKCMSCERVGGEMHVDHIKPISVHPELALDEENLQVLCRDCNLGKSNKFADDLRPKTTTILRKNREKTPPEIRADELGPLDIPKVIELLNDANQKLKGDTLAVEHRALSIVAARYSQRLKAAMADADAKKEQTLQVKLMKEYLDVQRSMKLFQIEMIA
jgi:hypothetical protein